MGYEGTTKAGYWLAQKAEERLGQAEDEEEKRRLSVDRHVAEFGLFGEGDHETERVQEKMKTIEAKRASTAKKAKESKKIKESEDSGGRDESDVPLVTSQFYA